MLVSFCEIRRPRIAGTTIHATQHYLGGFECIERIENYPDELKNSNAGLNPKNSSRADVTSYDFDCQNSTASQSISANPKA